MIDDTTHIEQATGIANLPDPFSDEVMAAYKQLPDDSSMREVVRLYCRVITDLSQAITKRDEFVTKLTNATSRRDVSWIAHYSHEVAEAAAKMQALTPITASLGRAVALFIEQSK